MVAAFIRIMLVTVLVVAVQSFDKTPASGQAAWPSAEILNSSSLCGVNNEDGQPDERVALFQVELNLDKRAELVALNKVTPQRANENGFEKAYVIWIGNEEHDFRGQNSERMSQLPHANWEFINGVTPDDIWALNMTEYGKGVQFENWFDPHNAKVPAIWVSHMRVLAKIASNTAMTSRPFLVLEADVSLERDWRKQVEDSLANVTKKDPAWDVLRLGYWGYKACSDKVTPDLYNMSTLHPPFLQAAFYSGIQGYAVTPGGAQKLLSRLRQMPIHNIDIAMSELSACGHILMYAVDSKPFTQTWNFNLLFTDRFCIPLAPKNTAKFC